jgi:pyridoxal phosphate enzyme (YggS family)
MNIEENLKRFKNITEDDQLTLVAVTKTHPVELLREAYAAGLKDFGENRVQELIEKFEELPKDICWHMIGHLQRNKVKQIAAFIHLIHSVDSFRLLKEINKQGENVGRVINCLLQIHIAKEDTKFGLDETELLEILDSEEFRAMNNIKVCGLMGMATNTRDGEQVRKEFKYLKELYDRIKGKYQSTNIDFSELSMGMSSDYTIALEEGSTMIRVGSAIFGKR